MVPREVDPAMMSLRAAANAMPKVKGFVSNFTKSLNLANELQGLNIKGDAISLLSSPQAANITGKVICGQPLTMINTEFELLKVAINEPYIDPVELKSLSSRSSFCKDGYLQIMRMQGGPIIWSFLKPILSGKVLYTPDNDLTRKVMGNLNGSLASVSRAIYTLEGWAQTIESLRVLYSDPKANDKVQRVKKLVIEFLGREVEGLFQNVDASRVIERLARTNGVLALVQLAGQVAQCFDLNRFVPFKTETALEIEARNLASRHELIAGIVFLNLQDYPGALLPQHVEYKIRANIDDVPSTKLLKERFWEPGPRDHYKRDLGYLRGFVQIQELIDRAIMATHLNQTLASQVPHVIYDSATQLMIPSATAGLTSLPVAPAVYLQQFPYSCYEADKFGNYIRALMPVVVTIAWVFLIAFLIRDHVLERELHLEEVLRVAGLKITVSWTVWFILAFMVMSFGSACAVFLLQTGQLIPNSDPFIIFGYFMAFCLSIIMFCYMMSSFFRTATLASLSGIVGYLATFLPFMVAITLEHEMTYWDKVTTCLSMSTSFCFGMMYMTRYESQGVGVQWSNLWHSPLQDDSMNFATALIVMLVDSAIYFIIGWYISNVFPRK